MRCTNHPRRDATAQCRACKRPFCAECGMHIETGAFVCMSCMVGTTLQQMTQRMDEKARAREIRAIRAKTRKKRTLVRVLVQIFLGALLVGGELAFLVVFSKNQAKQFAPPDSPMAFLMMIDDAIQEYREDHRGDVPKTLENLLGQYLPPDRVRVDDLKGVIYVRKTPIMYELRLKEKEGRRTPNLVLTEEAVELGGLP